MIPATLLAKLLPPRLWLGSAAIGWGICSTLMVGPPLLLSTEGQQSHLSGSPMQSTATNQAGLMAARIGLGVFEAAFGPGIPLYFSRHY
jgi:hypothetical protein